MKNKILKIGIIAVVAIVAFLNVNVALKSEKNNMMANITFSNVEALATELATEWNSILDWFTNGIRKDEIKRETPCSAVTSSSGTSTNTTPSITVTITPSGVVKYIIPVEVKINSGGRVETKNTSNTTHIPSGKKISCSDGGSE